MKTTLLGDISLISEVKLTNSTGNSLTKLIGRSSLSNIEQLVTYGFNNKQLDDENLANLLVKNSFDYLFDQGLSKDFTDLFVPTLSAGVNYYGYYFMLNSRDSSVIVMDLLPSITNLEIMGSDGKVLGLIQFENEELIENKYLVILFEQTDGESSISLKLHEVSKNPHEKLFDYVISELGARNISQQPLIDSVSVGIDKRSNTFLGVGTDFSGEYDTSRFVKMKDSRLSGIGTILTYDSLF